MNFQQLMYVVALNEHKHFARAAEACDVSQATLSVMLRKLEEELSLVLFDRSRSPVVITHDGERVLGVAREILAKRQEMLGLYDVLNDTATGELSIGVIPTVAMSLLPILLKSMLKAHPHIKLRIKEVTTEEIITLLEQGKLDVGILATPIDGVDLHTYPLYTEPMMVYGVGNGTQEFITKRDLKDQEVWLLEDGHCFKEQAMTVCDIQEGSRKHENLDFEGNSFDTLLNLTDSFGGYTLLPELYAKGLSRSRWQKCKRFKDPQPARQVSAMVFHPFVKKRLVDALIQVARKAMTTKLDSSQAKVVGVK